MAEYIEAKWDKVVQNLCDAGCESEDIQRFVQVLEAGQYREALCLLKKYRQILLDRCHAEEESNMNILVLNGSPRPGGNTKQMVAAFREGAQSVGHTVEAVDVCKKQVGGCQACEYCHTRGNGQCIQKDDMQQIYDLLKQADTLVLASPIYYHGLSGQLKCVIDRFYAVAYPQKPPRLSKVAMILSSGDAEMYEGALFSFQGDFLDYLGLENMGVYTAHGSENGSPTKLEELRAFGASLK